jgi:hypothetical protein
MGASPHLTLREARAGYFRDNGIAEDGGYDTTLVGEAEIGAWELASGCRTSTPRGFSTSARW